MSVRGRHDKSKKKETIASTLERWTIHDYFPRVGYIPRPIGYSFMNKPGKILERSLLHCRSIGYSRESQGIGCSRGYWSRTRHTQKRWIFPINIIKLLGKTPFEGCQNTAMDALAITVLRSRPVVPTDLTQSLEQIAVSVR